MKVSINSDFTNSPNIPKNVADRIKKRLSEPQKFQLFFDQTQSLFQKEEKLDSPKAGRGGMFMRFGLEAGSITYTNLVSAEQTSQKELFGKKFLISKNINYKLLFGSS